MKTLSDEELLPIPYRVEIIKLRTELAKKNNLIKEVIERLENYPTCMSCYLKQEEAKAATGIKNKFIEILKEELL